MILIKVREVLEIHGLPSATVEDLRLLCQFNTAPFDDADTPSSLNLFVQEKDKIFIPRGFFNQIIKFCKANELPYKVEFSDPGEDTTAFSIVKGINYTTGDFGFQGKAVDELLKYSTARLQSGTGSGKTIMACIVAAKLQKQPILFLANKDRLLKQFCQTVTKALNISEDEIGIIKAAKFKIKPITIGSLQTIGKSDFPIEKIRDVFHTILYDECHLSTAITYRRVLLGLAPRRLYGFSATPEHYNNPDLSRLMQALLGPIAVKIKDSDIPGRLIPKTVTKNTKITYRYDGDSSQPSWLQHKLRNGLQLAIMNDNNRNNLIIKDCLDLVKKGHKVLITTTRVAHALLLCEQLSKRGLKCAAPYKDGSETTTVDHKLLDASVQAMMSGELDVLSGTYNLFDTGFDCQNLSALLMAAPFSGDNTTKVKQCVGRLLRSYPNKLTPEVIDYVDDSTPNAALKTWGNKRADCLRQEFNNHSFC